MIKQFNIPGFGITALLTIPAPSVVASSRISMAEMKNTDNERAKPSSHHFGRILSVLAVIALLIGGGWYYYQQHNPVPSSPIVGQTPTNYITNDQLEAQYGVRVTLIAVTAVGGIVDFRYKVSDPVKAATLLHDPANAPTLTAIDSGLTLSGTQMSRHHKQMGMKRGAVPFTFFPNVRGAVKPGVPVSVAFGKIKVEPIVAQ
jgi:hypothetical protein